VITLVPSAVALLASEKFIAGLGTHGLQISSITQTLLVVLILGAGTDYGPFLVYRFREELQAGTEPLEAVARALTRVAESITASASTVLLALLTLLLASFGLYRDLAVPLALGIATTLLAGLTLLPALLALSAGVLFPGIRRGAGGRAARQHGWWAGVAARAVRRPGVTLGAGVLILGVLALATFGYRTANLNSATTAPPGSDAARGNALVAADFPQATVSPASLILSYPAPVWQRPAALAKATASLSSSRLFSTLSGPLDPNGVRLSAGAYARLRTELGAPQLLPLTN
jgi:RND superfamily putative drug exporter